MSYMFSPLSKSMLTGSCRVYLHGRNGEDKGEFLSMKTFSFKVNMICLNRIFVTVIT